MRIIKYINIYTLILVITCMLLTLVSLIPKECIKDSVKEGLEVLEIEGLGPKTILGYNAVLDNFSDAVILNTIYSLDASKPFMSSMNANNTIIPDKNMELGNPIVSLRNLLENETGYQYNYSRYWHGYIIYLKPLLVF